MDISLVFMEILLLSVVKAVDILDVKLSQREKECYGSNMGFSFSGTHEYHYEALRRRYSGCTHVHGNLEVTNLNNGNVTYDLSFLSTIQVVTGGDHTLKLGYERYGLVVALTSEGTPTPDNPTPGLKELQMPSLREISKGKVLFTQNPLLCYIDTVDWSSIVNGGIVMKENAMKSNCDECHADCQDSSGVGHCWGKGPNMCYKFQRMDCDSICPGSPPRCFEEGILGCCHPQCAAGCRGGLDTECEMCKYFRHGHRCVTLCPEGTYPIGQECIDF